MVEGSAAILRSILGPPERWKRVTLGARDTLFILTAEILRSQPLARTGEGQGTGSAVLGLEGPRISKEEGDLGCTCLSLPPALLCMYLAGWKFLAMLALVLVVIMVWYSISREDRYIEL